MELRMLITRRELGDAQQRWQAMNPFGNGSSLAGAARPPSRSTSSLSLFCALAASGYWDAYYTPIFARSVHDTAHTQSLEPGIF